MWAVKDLYQGLRYLFDNSNAYVLVYRPTGHDIKLGSQKLCISILCDP